MPNLILMFMAARHKQKGHIVVECISNLTNQPTLELVSKSKKVNQQMNIEKCKPKNQLSTTKNAIVKH